MKKHFVCMAKSWKHGNYCIAGREVLAGGELGGWIRPVSAGENTSVPVGDVSFGIGDIVSCDVTERRSAGHQTENFVLSRNAGWRVEGRMEARHLDFCAEAPERLWAYGYSSSLGRNDRVPERQADSCGRSLYLIRPEAAAIIAVAKEGARGEYLQRRLLFKYGGLLYNLAVTDPVLSDRYSGIEAGSGERLGKCLLTISLGESYAGYLYKLAAGFIEL